MTCTLPGIVACIFSIIALALSASSLGLPMWSIHTIDGQPGGLINYQSDFGIGVWGVCEDNSVSNNTTESDLHTCHMYYSTYQLESISDLTKSNLVLKNSSSSLCQNYQLVLSKPKDLWNETLHQLKYSEGIAELFYDNSGESFLGKTCGGLGKFTLAMSILAMIFGVILTLLVVLGVTCCKTASFMVSFAGISGIISCLFCFIAMITWIVQANPIKADGMTYGVSFKLNIVCIFIYLLAFLACFRHVKKGKKSEAARDIKLTHRRPPIAHGKRTNLV